MNNERDSFIFYRSFRDAINTIESDVDKLSLYRAIVEYGITQNEPAELQGASRGMFMLIRPQIDANQRRFINGCNGGAPKGNQNATKKQPKNNLKTTDQQANVNDNVNANDNEIHSGKSADIPGVCFQIVDLIKEHCKNHNRKYNINRDKSANIIRLMQSSDKIKLETIQSAFIRYMQLYSGEQFEPQIFSADSLRDKWNKIIAYLDRQEHEKKPITPAEDYNPPIESPDLPPLPSIMDM